CGRRKHPEAPCGNRALSPNLSWEGQGVERRSAAGADETLAEVLGIQCLAGGRLKRRALLHRSRGGWTNPKEILDARMGWCPHPAVAGPSHSVASRAHLAD